MFPMDRKAINELAVYVEYDSRGQRVVKRCKNSIEASRFYRHMMKAGKNPVVKKH